MQISQATAAPTPVVSTFQMTVTDLPKGTVASMSPLKQAKLEVEGIAAQHGVELLDWSVQPSVAETSPTQSRVQGSLRGASDAVSQVLAAISELDTEI